MGFNITDAGHVLKKTYAGKGPENIVTRDRMLLSHFRKVGGFSGESDHRVPVIYANNNAISANFSYAQADADSSSGFQWNLTRQVKYGVFTVTGEFLAASDSAGSFVMGLKHAVDSTLDEFGRQMSVDLYGDGTAAIGAVTSNATRVITLTDAEDAKNFNVGMYIAVYNSGGTEQDSSETQATCPVVTAVDEDSGTVTFSNVTAADNMTSTDVLYKRGNKDSVISGLEDWLPIAAPSSGESFFGQDRSVDVARLSGSRVTDTSLSLQEAIMDLCTSINRRGGRPRHGYMNPTNWNKLAKELDAKVQREAGVGASFGFPYIEVATSAGMIKFYPDQDCPGDRGYVIDHRGCYIKHLKELPHMVTDDKNRILRQASADGVEGRFRCWWQPVFTAPAWSGVFQIS